MSSSASSFHKDNIPTSRPIWREALLGLDWLALRTSPVYFGYGVPRGDGSAVILIPGFLATDHYLYEMYYWLRRIGYRPYLSKIGLNAECLDVLVERLSETVAKASAEAGGKVHLIGHSLGGIIARSYASQFPHQVTSVITLGSPFRGISSHPIVLGTAERIRARILRRQNQREKQPDCYSGYCQCATVTCLQSEFPPSVRQTAIYTKTDGIVDWRVCLNDDPATDFEVAGTHVGLAFNPSVYHLIASRLFDAEKFRAEK
jgi:pimeloyl-ACP methyl ester carboxylesterase